MIQHERASAQWTAPRGIPALTGIRGLAACYVFLTHYQPLAAAFLKDPAINNNSFMYNGFRGVDLFFVLSGFILMHVHSRDFDAIAWPDLRSFYILRFLRVYPLNTVVLLTLVPVGVGLPAFVQWIRQNHGIDLRYHVYDFSAAGFVQTLLLAQTWTVLKLGEWNGPSWTLSAEVVGYAFFPFVAQYLGRRRSAAVCLLQTCVSCAVLIGLLILFGHARNNPTGSFGLVRLIFAFAAGMCLCRVFQLWQPTRWPAGTVITLSAVAFITLALAVPVLNVTVVVGFGALIIGLAYRQGPVAAVAESRLAMFLGRISFSFYLVHYMILKLWFWLYEAKFPQAALMPRVVALLAVPLLCVVVAMTTYRFVEQPFQRLAHRLAGRRQRTIRRRVRPA